MDFWVSPKFQQRADAYVHTKQQSLKCQSSQEAKHFSFILVSEEVCFQTSERLLVLFHVKKDIFFTTNSCFKNQNRKLVVKILAAQLDSCYKLHSTKETVSSNLASIHQTTYQSISVLGVIYFFCYHLLIKCDFAALFCTSKIIKYWWKCWKLLIDSWFVESWIKSS